MKSGTVFAFLFAGLIAYAALQQRQQARPQQLAIPARNEPVLQFGGKIVRHVKEGVIVRCREFIAPLPPGYNLDHVQGEFLLTNSAAAASLPDNASIRFAAQHAGLYRYKSSLGDRTISHVVNVAGGTANPAASTATNWQPQGTLLDSKPR